MSWADGWIWLVAALVLALLEIAVTAQVLLGFGIGAAVVGLMLALGGAPGAVLARSLPLTLAVFALASLAGFLGLRRWLGHGSRAKVITRDINDND